MLLRIFAKHFNRVVSIWSKDTSHKRFLSCHRLPCCCSLGLPSMGAELSLENTGCCCCSAAGLHTLQHQTGRLQLLQIMKQWNWGSLLSSDYSTSVRHWNHKINILHFKINAMQALQETSFSATLTAVFVLNSRWWVPLLDWANGTRTDLRPQAAPSVSKISTISIYYIYCQYLQYLTSVSTISTTSIYNSTISILGWHLCLCSCSWYRPRYLSAISAILETLFTTTRALPLLLRPISADRKSVHCCWLHHFYHILTW